MYDITTVVDIEYSDAIEKVKLELAKEGFGVLTEIDIKATLKKKLDVEIEEYIIMGACNPPLANEALKIEKEIGLLLPCNIIVYRNNGKTIISAIKPREMFSIVEHKEELENIAGQVEEKLKNVISRL
ncbi:MAG: DUF302 domain-containing protein [Methanosarcinales archaeon]|nr:DUF302 domain-containing protein [Methanosarcinales archaeon]